MCQQQCTDNDKRNDKIQTTYIGMSKCLWKSKFGRYIEGIPT